MIVIIVIITPSIKFLWMIIVECGSAFMGRYIPDLAGTYFVVLYIVTFLLSKFRGQNCGSKHHSRAMGT